MQLHRRPPPPRADARQRSGKCCVQRAGPKGARKERNAQRDASNRKPRAHTAAVTSASARQRRAECPVLRAGPEGAAKAGRSQAELNARRKRHPSALPTRGARGPSLTRRIWPPRRATAAQHRKHPTKRQAPGTLRHRHHTTTLRGPGSALDGASSWACCRRGVRSDQPLWEGPRSAQQAPAEQPAAPKEEAAALRRRIRPRPAVGRQSAPSEASKNQRPAIGKARRAARRSSQPVPHGSLPLQRGHHARLQQGVGGRWPGPVGRGAHRHCATTERGCKHSRGGAGPPCECAL